MISGDMCHAFFVLILIVGATAPVLGKRFLQRVVEKTNAMKPDLVA